MIASRSLKRLLAQVALILGALITFGAILVVTQVVSFSSTSADPASALHRVAELPVEADAIADWAPDAWAQERAMEPATRIALQAAYVRAWAAIGVYQTTGDSIALGALFSGPAKINALAVPRDGPVATWSVAHRLRLEFYSLDGGTVALTDVTAKVVRTVGTGSGEVVADSTESYSVVMVLEDEYWRVRQLRRTGSTSTVISTTSSGATNVLGGTPTAPIAAADFRATDYTPADWPATTDAVLATDFSRVRDLGLDTVRLRLPFGLLTGPASLDRLPELLGTARAAGVSVVLVLFDGTSDISPAAWALADHQVAELVNAVADDGARQDPAVVMWDVADQPDLRTKPASAVEIRAFLVHEALLLRSLIPTMPLTISWADPAAAADPAFVGLVDVISVHWAGSTGDLPEVIGDLTTAADGRPIAVTASTTPTNGGWSPLPHSERRQAVEVADFLLVTEDSGISRISVNQLSDSATDQRGALRADGSNKPAAALLRPGAPLDTVSGPGPVDYVSSNFWRVALAVIAFGLLFGFRHRLMRAGRKAGKRQRDTRSP